MKVRIGGGCWVNVGGATDYIEMCWTKRLFGG